MWPWPRPLFKNFPRGHVQTVLMDMLVKFEVRILSLTVFEQLAFKAQKFRVSRDPGHAPFWKNFSASYPDCPYGCARQIWSLYLEPYSSKWHLTPKNLGGHVTLATPLFENFPRGHVRTVPEDVLVKFEVRIFNRFCAISRLSCFLMCLQCDVYTRWRHLGSQYGGLFFRTAERE